ncbi:PPE domain-containing protein [Rhodococcus kroppenstedtii]|uniref:PPE domain-containing protein n=1 Tax=Rhodococcoides kroppenstedtii TaxID=293050 RepID=UPI001C9B09D8|nr:PPE domain-containing protein [Rhodococcus kroppenstedtii]MBY6438537.1 PPE domain-containing protein [Rhodococcus kroppenstedtii]
MTAGPTGVVWLPRTAAVNSATLLAGPGPVPATAAATAWSGAAGAFADVAATLSRVGLALGAAWDGVAADAATGGLAATAGWASVAADRCAATATRAGAHAAAVSAARLTMPTPVEIAAVEGTRAAAYATGGAATGAAQAADAARLALDVRAAAVMEVYEAATATLAAPEVFDPPPPVTSGAPGIAPTSVTAVPPWLVDAGRDAHPGSPARGDDRELPRGDDRELPRGDDGGSAPDPEELESASTRPEDHRVLPTDGEEPALTRAATSALQSGGQTGHQMLQQVGQAALGGVGDRPGLGTGGVGSGVLGGGSGFAGPIGAGGPALTAPAGRGGVGLGEFRPVPWAGDGAVGRVAESAGGGPAETSTAGTDRSGHRAPFGTVPTAMRPAEEDTPPDRPARASRPTILDDRDGLSAVLPVIGEAPTQ